MTINPKREFEQRYFEVFQKHYSLPHGTIIYKDKPDIIIEGIRKIGIEITNFYLEGGSEITSLQVQKARGNSVLKKAQANYLSNGGKRVVISFGFNRTQPIQYPIALSRKITELAMRIEYFKSGKVDREHYKQIPELDFVYFNSTEYENPLWQDMSVYSGQLMSREKLMEIVRKKEIKAKDYRNCDAYWLLVIVECLDRAQDQDIQIDHFEKIHSDVFEKGFVFKTYAGHMLEII